MLSPNVLRTVRYLAGLNDEQQPSAPQNGYAPTFNDEYVPSEPAPAAPPQPVAAPVAPVQAAPPQPAPAAYGNAGDDPGPSQPVQTHVNPSQPVAATLSLLNDPGPSGTDMTPSLPQARPSQYGAAAGDDQGQARSTAPRYAGSRANVQYQQEQGIRGSRSDTSSAREVVNAAGSALMDAAEQQMQPPTSPLGAAVTAGLNIVGGVTTNPYLLEAGRRVIDPLIAAQQAGGGVIGRRILTGLGGNEEAPVMAGETPAVSVHVPGSGEVTVDIPGSGRVMLTQGQLAELIGAALTDPTNIIGGPKAAGAARATGNRLLRGAEHVMEAGQRAAGRAIGGGILGAGGALLTGQDPDTVGKSALAGAGLAIASPAARPLMRGAGRVLEPVARGLGEAAADRLLAMGSHVIQPSGAGGGSGRTPGRLTVEALRDRIDRVLELREKARTAGDANLEEDANGVLGQLQNDLIDAMNARLRAEPAIESDIGRRIENLPLDAETGARMADAQYPQERVPAAEVPRTQDDAPRSVVGRASSLVPFDPASAAAGGLAGTETDEDGNPIGVDPLRTAGGVLAAGIVGKRFPGVQKALAAAARRQARITAQGLEKPSAWDWIKQAGYSGIYGPTTAVSATIGGAQELLLAQPKEFVRALVEGRPGAYGAQVRAQIKAMPDALSGLARVLRGSDSAATAAVSGGSQGTANLSDRVANPLGHLAARLLERPGEVLTEAPDAVFRPLFIAQGAQREAARVAAEMRLRGSQATTYAESLMRDVEAVRNGQLPQLPETQRVIDAADQYADQLGFKGKPGAFGQWLAKLSSRNDAVGVAASFLMPFPSMAARMTEAGIKMTPGAALLPSVRKTYPSRFDMVYDQSLGTVAAAGVAYWAMTGGITGSGPSDPGQRAEMIAQGWQPNSLLIGGHYIPNRVMGRFQGMLDTAGELHDALAYGKSGRTAPQIATDLATRAKKIATDQIGLSGLADLNDLLDDGFSSQFPGFAARSITRYLPYGGVIRAGATATDPLQRRAEPWKEGSPLPAIGEQLQTAIPGQRQRVPAAQDVLGRPMENPQQGLGAIAPRTTTLRNDPAVRLFQDAGVSIGNPSDTISVGRRAIPVGLKPAEQRRWQTLRGQFITDYADAYTSNADFMALPPAQKEKYLKTFLSKAADYADKMLQSEMDTDDLTTRATEGALKKAGVTP